MLGQIAGFLNNDFSVVLWDPYFELPIRNTAFNSPHFMDIDRENFTQDDFDFLTNRFTILNIQKQSISPQSITARNKILSSLAAALCEALERKGSNTVLMIQRGRLGSPPTNLMEWIKNPEKNCLRATIVPIHVSLDELLYFELSALGFQSIRTPLEWESSIPQNERNSVVSCISYKNGKN